MSATDILSEYPELKREEIITAIDYATKLVSKTNPPKAIKAEKSVATLHEINR